MTYHPRCLGLLRGGHALRRYGEDVHIRTHIAYVARAGVDTLPVYAQYQKSDFGHGVQKRGMRRTGLTVVRAKLETCFVYREAQLQVHGNRGGRYVEVREGGQMHQSDVPECAAGALAAN
jgi:hypothetical protein